MQFMKFVKKLNASITQGTPVLLVANDVEYPEQMKVLTHSHVKAFIKPARMVAANWAGANEADANPATGEKEDKDKSDLVKLLVVSLALALVIISGLTTLGLYFMRRNRAVMSLAASLATASSTLSRNSNNQQQQQDSCVSTKARSTAEVRMAINRIKWDCLHKADPLIKNGKACAICIDAFRPYDQVRHLPCRHSFHKLCVDPWLKIKHVCPLCKVNVVEIVIAKAPHIDLPVISPSDSTLSLIHYYEEDEEGAEFGSIYFSSSSSSTSNNNNNNRKEEDLNQLDTATYQVAKKP